MAEGSGEGRGMSRPEDHKDEADHLSVSAPARPGPAPPHPALVQAVQSGARAAPPRPGPAQQTRVSPPIIIKTSDRLVETALRSAAPWPLGL